MSTKRLVDHDRLSGISVSAHNGIESTKRRDQRRLAPTRDFPGDSIPLRSLRVARHGSPRSKAGHGDSGRPVAKESPRDRPSAGHSRPETQRREHLLPQVGFPTLGPSIGQGSALVDIPSHAGRQEHRESERVGTSPPSEGDASQEHLMLPHISFRSAGSNPFDGKIARFTGREPMNHRPEASIAVPYPEDTGLNRQHEKVLTKALDMHSISPRFPFSYLRTADAGHHNRTIHLRTPSASHKAT